MAEKLRTAAIIVFSFTLAGLAAVNDFNFVSIILSWFSGTIFGAVAQKNRGVVE